MHPGRFWKHPLFWLGLMVAVFFAVSLYSGVVAYDNFGTANSTDAGVITQAVASTTFGHQAPFYESQDCLGGGRCSFMLVHTGFILYLAVPFYAIAPSTVTLIALRSFFVAVAAVPLYWLTRQVTQSRGKGLLAAGLYLVWAPTLAGDAFSLHLESLLPFELLSLAALWQAGRYRWGLVAAVTAFLTMEIAPVFVFLIGVFFFIPYVERAVRRHWIKRNRERNDAPSPESPRPTVKGTLREGLASRGVRYTLALMVAAPVAYLVLYSFINVWGAGVLGVTSPAFKGLFYAGAATPSHGYSVLLTSSAAKYTAEYWLILYALVAFIPLLSPRALVISVPWIGYTFLTDISRPAFSTLGLQYTMVAAGPIFIGLAYGLRWIPFGGQRSPATDAEGTQNAVSSAGRPSPTRRRWRSRAVTSGIATVLAVVIVANVLFSPINPLLPSLGYRPGAPFKAGYFDHDSLVITPGIAWAEQLIANIPMNATIVASSPLFPLVANYPYAIVLELGIQPFTFPDKFARLPFSMPYGPEFVFIAKSDLRSLNTAFLQNLSDPRKYGERGYVASSAAGPLLLYERNYTGPTEYYGPPLGELNASYWPDQGLSAGPDGRVASSSTAPEGKMIRSIPKTNVTGEVWTGPGVQLANGNYVLHIEVSATGSSLLTDPNASVLGLVVAGTEPEPLNETFPASTFVSGVWTNLTVNFTAPSTIPEVDFEGFLLDTQVSIAIAYLTVQPSGPS